MSAELTANLSSNSVDASLTEIDSWSKNGQTTNNSTLAVGPFSVLNLQVAAATVPEPNEVAVLEESEAEPAEELFPTPSTLDPLMSLDDSLQWADLFALDFGNEYFMQQDAFAPAGEDVLPQLQDEVGQNATWDTNSHVISASQSRTVRQSGFVLAPVSPLVDVSAPTTDLLGNMHVLLRHFQDRTINDMAGVPWTEKSPWKSCHLANAVQTLADMTYLGEKTVKHANASNLYGLVSCAARHIILLPQNPSLGSTEVFKHIANWALEKAKLHLEYSLQKEFSGPIKAKYKDQLMATMSVMTACQIAGHQADTRRYLLECERVLRLRGLAKREISRKARVLHHIYTWARIVGESTYVIHDYSSYASAVQSLGSRYQRRVSRVVETGTNTAMPGTTKTSSSRLDDFLRLESQHDSDLEIDEPKEPEKALHDIHLEDSRDWTNSLYLQIYGIPETWLSLVSQTTRLANIMDTLKVSDKDTNVAFQDALQKRARRLENMICSFAFRTSSADSTMYAADSDANATNLPHRHMLKALNSALVILFYRRIRDVNPWILQSHVDDVIRALNDFDIALGTTGLGPGSPWAAFVAGCEAVTPQKRQPLLNWIQTGYVKSGMQSFKAAEEMLLEVWRRRDEANDGPSPRSVKPAGALGASGRAVQRQWTWVDIARERTTWLMLS